jgi:hypothetical protein
MTGAASGGAGVRGVSGLDACEAILLGDFNEDGDLFNSTSKKLKSRPLSCSSYESVSEIITIRNIFNPHTLLL